MQILVETTPLHGWVTLVEVSEALGIPYDTIRRIARKAHEEQQDWVKRAPYPTASSPLRWLVNTNHERYRSHAQCWLERAAQEYTAPERACGLKSHDQKTAPGSHAARDMRTPTTDVRETWPQLCKWLADMGLVVFVNALATEPNWVWSWDDEGGSGYATATEAITAAIQHRLLFGDPFFPYLGSQEPGGKDTPADDTAPDGESKEAAQADPQTQA